VKNESDRDGEEVIQLYASFPDATVPRPRIALKGFMRIRIAAGDTAKLGLIIRAEDVAYWSTQDHAWKLEPGRVVLSVGPSSADIRLTAELALQE
jgi:beta-glucosidase